MPEQEWPADHIERRALSALTPYEKNARTHTDEQIDQVAASIGEWGWTMPVLVDEAGGIIAGHCRVMAAERMGLDEVPVIVAAGWTEEQKRAYVIADNKLTDNGGWNQALLAEELQELQGGFDVSLIGFSEDELAALSARANSGLTDPDDAPEAPVNPVAVLGDVWLLGKHRLVCGDSTDSDTVAKCLNGVEPHLMVADPPYGVEYDADWRTTARNANGALLSTGSGRAKGKVENDGRADWSEAWALFPGDVAYVWHGGNHAHVVAESLIACKLEIRAQIIWAKSNLVVGRGHYHPKHEPCWYAVRKGATGHWAGDRKQTTLWQIDKPQKSETGHSTQKPVECMKRPMENNSSPGQAVYDPFIGSGTSIIAAEMTGRACHGLEIEPKYCDVTINRWQDFTGEDAVHEPSGKTFEEMSADRYDPTADSKGSYDVAIDEKRKELEQHGTAGA